MAVKVFIRRTVAEEKQAGLVELIQKLRSLAVTQPGYISGETLRSVSDPLAFMVISTWETVEDWEAWKSSRERSEVQGRIDEMLGQETVYDAYYYPRRSATLSGFKGWEGG